MTIIFRKHDPALTPKRPDGQKRQLGSAALLYLDAALCTTPEKRKKPCPDR
jgi:hypothetical protein